MKSILPAMAAILAGLVLTGPAGVARADDASNGNYKFVAGPTAVRTGDSATISFTLSAAADVQVTVLDGQGNVVRRLAAGLLGPNAPAPLARDSLAQSLTWDGTDDMGRKVLGADPKATFTVRVDAGLRATYAGTAMGSEAQPNDLTNVIGLAAGGDGQVYVLSERWKRAWWTHTAIHVYGRDGKYVRTIKPFPADLAADKLAKLTPLTDEAGHAVPVIQRVLAIDYYPAEDCPQQMAVSPDGNIHLLTQPLSYVGDRDEQEFKMIASLAPDGSVACDSYVGAHLASRTIDVGDAYLACSGDGKSVFATGMDITVRKDFDPDSPRPKRVNVPAVLRIDLPARSTCKPLFGDPDKSGSDDAHLSDPRGLAADGKGQLYVADCGNDRIVVLDESSGRFVRAMPVKAPTWLGYSQAAHALYVATGGDVVKYKVANGALAEQARLKLPELDARNKSAKWSFALDGQADGATLWVGLSRGGDALSYCREADNKFGALTKADYNPARHFWSLACGFDGKTVACKAGDRTLRILDETTGQTRDLKLADSGGQTYRLGPDNQIYGMDHWRWGIRRWDAQGKPLPFPQGIQEGEGKGRTESVASGTTNWERDFDVDREGNVYVKQRGKIYHGRMRVDKYDSSGKFVGTVVWVVTDGAQGPRINRDGDLYFAEAVKPPGVPFPDFFKGKLPPTRVDLKTNVEGQYRWMYGSVVKFGPAGGAFWFPIADPRSDAYPFDGEPTLPADQPRMKVDTVSGDRVIVRPGEIQGARWMHFGVSYILDMQPGANRRCHCTATGFDLDRYGRVYYTDQGMFRVVVLDAAGNELLKVGRYGNQDSFGKEGTPDVAFNWFIGLAASDRYIYVGDGANHRLVRLAIGHAVTGSCELKSGG
ncbi:MAG: hypothetical protein BIFFINMI_01579 [Phycisphaerae bacterium]|nr:hypothetical protein [Phycisphaerae bacterium]